MITLVLMGLLGTALILGLVPVAMFGLMLETCKKRGQVTPAARAASGVFRTDGRLAAAATRVNVAAC